MKAVAFEKSAAHLIMVLSLIICPYSLAVQLLEVFFFSILQVDLAV